MNTRTRNWTNEWTNDECINELINQEQNKWLTDWLNDWMNEWINELMNELMNEYSCFVWYGTIEHGDSQDSVTFLCSSLNRTIPREAFYPTCTPSSPSKDQKSKDAANEANATEQRIPLVWTNCFVQNGNTPREKHCATSKASGASGGVSASNKCLKFQINLFRHADKQADRQADR